MSTAPAGSFPHEAVIAFGANLGDREGTIRQAARDIAAVEGVDLVALSPLHDTTALKLDGEDPDAPRYLNAVAIVRTVLGPETLLAELNRIEHAHGRTREVRWGDRTLDLDIVDYDGITQGDATLTLPHPRAHERDFVLRPWLDIAPDAVLPGHGRVADLLAELDAATALLDAASAALDGDADGAPGALEPRAPDADPGASS